jgi:hypothetical protein
MNILPPVPTPTIFNTGTVNIEAARRDNTQRETVPQLAAIERSAAESGAGPEADRVKTLGQAIQPLTYEKPTSQIGQPFNTQSNSTRDNGKNASAGKENAEQQQQQQAELQQLTQLTKRDTEVRAHEQAHASLGGQYASSPQYEYERGPDGKRYAVSGEVSIDIGEASTPQKTLRKVEQVKAAALAPAEPSAQDLRVATEAAQIATVARTEIADEQAEKVQQSYERAVPSIQQDKQAPQNSDIEGGPSVESVVAAVDIGIPTRILNTSQISTDKQNVFGTELDSHSASQFIANRDLEITRRVSMIENFYQQVTNPRLDGVQQSA